MVLCSETRDIAADSVVQVFAVSLFHVSVPKVSQSVGERAVRVIMIMMLLMMTVIRTVERQTGSFSTSGS